MATTLYSQLLLSPHWQRKRLEVMSRDNFKCVSCGEADLTLNVHHKMYLKNHMPWDYPLDNFQTLCYKCHQDKHEIAENYEKEQESAPVYRPASPEQLSEWGLLKEDEVPVISSIDLQIKELTRSLAQNRDEDTEIEIMKNVMYLQKTRKELLTK